MANLLRLIQKMKPKRKKKKKKQMDSFEAEDVKDDRELKKKLFPALAMPDDPSIRVGGNGMCIKCTFLITRQMIFIGYQHKSVFICLMYASTACELH